MRRSGSNAGHGEPRATGRKAQVLLLLCLILWAFPGTASTEAELQRVDPSDFPKASYHEGLAAVRLADGYGYIDRAGRVVIPPRFQYAQIFSEGLARVVVGDRSGYIDHQGHVVIAPRFHKAFKFSEGLARVCAPPRNPSLLFRIARVVGWEDRQAYPCGYIDRNGKLVIDYQFLPAEGFENGYAKVTSLEGREGVVDSAGRFIPNPR